MAKYKYKETDNIKRLLTELETLRVVFDNLKPLPHIEENLRRESLLKSALFSAKIEGNPLSLEEARQALKRMEEDSLLPRRREILETIKDHPYSSFDFLSRRFPTVNPKTLHYDLGQLQKKNFIVKAGATRGAVYIIKGSHYEN